MWTKKNSVSLSLIVTRIIMVLCLGVAAGVPFLITSRAFYYVGGIRTGMEPAMPVVIYLCLIPAFILLFSLDNLLRNIKNDEVFIYKNVKSLRIISWACFSVAIILLFAGIFVSLPFFVVSAAAGFFGLIIRVVKNVIEAAVDLKNENDFTI